MFEKSNQGYQLLDSGGFRKLEQVGPYRLVRPSLQAVWKPALSDREWKKAHATFHRNSQGKGHWEFSGKAQVPSDWSILWQDVKLTIKLTDFGHIGIFPEHHDFSLKELSGETVPDLTSDSKKPRLLNLFAYTGALSIHAAQLGYEVVHCDASRASVDWARKNAQESAGGELSIRWIVEDVRKFVARELRRGSVYDAIVLDPPSFGRGVKGEVWKIEDHLVELLESLSSLRSDGFHLLKLSSHSAGYTPVALQNLIMSTFGATADQCESFEMLVYEKHQERALPSGACCLYSIKK